MSKQSDLIGIAAAGGCIAGFIAGVCFMAVMDVGEYLASLPEPQPMATPAPINLVIDGQRFRLVGSWLNDDDQ